MTYDVAAWKHTGPLTDEEASVEFERRFEVAEANYEAGNRQSPCTELAELFARMRDRFPDPPWEDDPGDAADGDFVYLTMSYDQGPDVVEYIAQIAGSLGVVVYDPQAEALMS